MTQFGKVAVLFGGHSAEREVSLRSGAAVLAGLIRGGVDAHGIDTQDYSLGQLKEDGFERAFIVVHGRGGEDGTLQGALEHLGLPYTGSRVLGSALAMDKIRTKQVWKTMGLPTADFRVVHKGHFKTEDAAELLAQFDGPVFVKPANEGSSIGMTKATDAATLINAVEEAFKFDAEVLVERFIDGDEYTVSILGEQALPAIRLSTTHDFYDYSAKYQSGDTQYLCPCGLNEADEKTLGELSLAAFKAVAASGWGRVDLMRDHSGQWWLLEVNTVPGMTQTSLVPKSAKVAGLSFEQLVLSVLEQAY
ncbi:D-alanine--D-alanine ligase [Oceanisphaera pacifica]|uniref:D-alanine--D-alanine ligase n=1 Tax=Oceanisphaera pacifica TaxID=2818389 RepID=A0ABS3NFD8_9GAMM|nr:D-alanine--D-alanine ligase [Oceanisphaera pacifica]MBO1519298.1 D-alanine--D-alanine ligase [Oceanisphaera pacifica]